MGWVDNATPWSLYLPGKTRCPLYRRLGGPQGRSGRIRNISPPPGFDPRTVQPVESRYTDCTIPAIKETVSAEKCQSTWVPGIIEEAVRRIHARILRGPNKWTDAIHPSVLCSYRTSSSEMQPTRALSCRWPTVLLGLVDRIGRNLLKWEEIRIFRRSSIPDVCNSACLSVVFGVCSWPGRRIRVTYKINSAVLRGCTKSPAI